jgi:hypothetical protein
VASSQEEEVVQRGGGSYKVNATCNTGHTLPDCFAWLFQAFGTQLDHHYVMSTVLGYGLSHRIIAANPSLDWNVINTFLIILAACHQYKPLLSGFWSTMLTSTTDQAIDKAVHKSFVSQ